MWGNGLNVNKWCESLFLSLYYTHTHTHTHTHIWKECWFSWIAINYIIYIYIPCCSSSFLLLRLLLGMHTSFRGHLIANATGNNTDQLTCDRLTWSGVQLDDRLTHGGQFESGLENCRLIEDTFSFDEPFGDSCFAQLRLKSGCWRSMPSTASNKATQKSKGTVFWRTAVGKTRNGMIRQQRDLLSNRITSFSLQLFFFVPLSHTFGHRFMLDTVVVTGTHTERAGLPTIHARSHTAVQIRNYGAPFVK